MCQFFSLVSDGRGKIMYFDWELRQKCLSGELAYNPDSHTSIAHYCDYKGKMEDNLNKYEYSPLTKEFVVDQLNTKDDRKYVEGFCKKLDFQNIVPYLVIKPIVNPFKDRDGVVDEDALRLLKEWAGVRASLWVSIRDSVGSNIGVSVWDSVRDRVWDSVEASVWASVEASVRASVWGSVKASVRASVWDSVLAYTGTFFDIWDGNYLYQCGADLWERGLVPSLDGKIWRLHSRNGIVWQGTLGDLEGVN